MSDTLKIAILEVLNKKNVLQDVRHSKDSNTNYIHVCIY